MKILLDENMPHRIRDRFPGHDVYTVAYMRWEGIKNGELLKLAACDGFEAIVTKDTGLEYEQNVNALPCSVVIVEAASNSLKHIEPLIPAILSALASLAPRSIARVR